MVTTLTGAAMRCSALVFNRARRSSSLRPSPPTSVCFDILSLPGASAVATQVERLSSNETNKVAQSPRLQVCSGAGRVVAYCIGRLLGSVMGDVDLPEFCRPLHRICMRSVRLDPDHDAVMRIGGEAPGGGANLSVGIRASSNHGFPPPRIVNSAVRRKASASAE